MVEMDKNWSVKRNGVDRVKKSAYKSRGVLPANQNAGRYHFSEAKGYCLSVKECCLAMTKGLRACGYIQCQNVTNILLSPCMGMKTQGAGSVNLHAPGEQVHRHL